jgi:hypothetical protein
MRGIALCVNSIREYSSGHQNLSGVLSLGLEILITSEDCPEQFAASEKGTGGRKYGW